MRPRNEEIEKSDRKKKTKDNTNTEEQLEKTKEQKPKKISTQTVKMSSRRCKSINGENPIEFNAVKSFLKKTR